MVYKSLFYTILFLAVSHQISAQITTEKVIDLYLEAVGGKEEWQEMKSYMKVCEMLVSMGGKLERLGGMKTFYAQKPNLTRMEVDESKWGGRSTVIFDGKEAWIKNSIEGFKIFDNYVKQEVFGTSFLVSYFLSSKYKFELVGTEKFEKQKYWILKKTNQNNNSKWFWFINQETHLIDFGNSKGSLKSKTFQKYSNYKKVNNLYIPFERIGYVEGKIITKDILHNIEVNPELSDSFFQR